MLGDPTTALTCRSSMKGWVSDMVDYQNQIYMSVNKGDSGHHGQVIAYDPVAKAFVPQVLAHSITTKGRQNCFNMESIKGMRVVEHDLFIHGSDHASGPNASSIFTLEGTAGWREITSSNFVWSCHFMGHERFKGVYFAIQEGFYMGKGAGIRYSDDNGVTFKSLTSDDPTLAQLLKVTPYGSFRFNGKLYYTYFGGSSQAAYGVTPGTVLEISVENRVPKAVRRLNFNQRIPGTVTRVAASVLFKNRAFMYDHISSAGDSSYTYDKAVHVLSSLEPLATKTYQIKGYSLYTLYRKHGQLFALLSTSKQPTSGQRKYLILSTADGTTWQPVTVFSTPAKEFVSDMALVNDTLYLGEEASLYALPLSADVLKRFTRLNVAPVARADSFTGDAGKALRVSGSFRGVLANDSDGNSDPLTATVTAQPASGTLQFSSNGTFTYTPKDATVTRDSFQYRISDGRTTSRPVRVSITLRSSAPAGE